MRSNWTRRRWLAAAIVAGVALLATALGTAAAGGRRGAEPASPSRECDIPPIGPGKCHIVAGGEAAGEAGVGDAVGRSVRALQERLRGNPSDARAWARLGAEYVELARATADPSWYGKAQGALDRSLALQREGNGAAMLGMGALANARHDFVVARDWAQRAAAVLPDTAEVYGVLADALTQLGDAGGATAAVQRMLDLRPSVASFSRASYELELHGRPDEARAAMERALQDATSRDESAFCRYYLGELAFNSGRLDDAQREYELGLAAAPGHAALREGTAKVAAARGDVQRALDTYREVVAAVPLPQYLQEYAALLGVAGRAGEAAEQYAVLAQQQRLAEAAGATDDLTAALVAADRGDAAEALRRASAEWERRGHVLVADAMAWALHLSGRDAEALGYADRAAALGTVDAAFAYHRGMILRGLGRDGEAAGALADALRINPYFSPVHAPLAGGARRQLRGQLGGGR